MNASMRSVSVGVFAVRCPLSATLPRPARDHLPQVRQNIPRNLIAVYDTTCGFRISKRNLGNEQKSQILYMMSLTRSTGQLKGVRRKFLIFGQLGLCALSRLGPEIAWG